MLASSGQKYEIGIIVEQRVKCKKENKKWVKEKKNESITINAPLILKAGDIIFLSGAKHIMGHFAGFFEGAGRRETRDERR
jgi:hypothetical protein